MGRKDNEYQNTKPSQEPVDKLVGGEGKAGRRGAINNPEPKNADRVLKKVTFG